MTSLPLRPSSSADAAALCASSAIDVADRLSAMLSQESSATYRPVDYLSADTTLGDMERQDLALSRSKMCEWGHQLVDVCQLSRQSVARSMAYFDRFLATHHKRARRALKDKREYQLASMACLYISVKIHEPLAMDANLLSEISAGCYSVDEILDMEQVVLRALGWRTSDPTPREFACHLLGLLGPNAYGHDLFVLREVLDASAHQCEVATGDYELNTACLPSEIGMAAVLNGLDDESLSRKARYRCLLRLCDVLPDVSMRRAARIQARLRKMCLPHQPPELARRVSSRSVMSDISMADRWISESEEEAVLCQEVACSSPIRSTEAEVHCITPTDGPTARAA
ncbi:hypothetical protein ACHAXT_002718 [Thalassiosira profunda]